MSRLRSDKLVNKNATGAPELTYGATVPSTGTISGAGGINLTGIVTATTFSGNLTGTATTATNLADAANITTGTVAAARLSGSYNIDVTGNINSSGVSTLTTLNGTSGLVSLGSTIKIKGFVETQTSASVASNILNLDASQGTVFTHTTSAQIGIVSFTGIRIDGAGTQTFSVLVTQGASPTNTTGATGIGTQLATVVTTGGVGYSTHIKVGAGSSIVLTGTEGALDLLTFIVSYDGNSPANNTFKVVGFAATDFRNAIV
jgi:hypothetical protein